MKIGELCAARGSRWEADNAVTQIGHPPTSQATKPLCGANAKPGLMFVRVYKQKAKHAPGRQR
jgi:hypothetical protein